MKKPRARGFSNNYRNIIQRSSPQNKTERENALIHDQYFIALRLFIIAHQSMYSFKLRNNAIHYLLAYLFNST
jgi:hypothetical protein